MRDASRIIMSLFVALSIAACDDAESASSGPDAGAGGEGGGEPVGSRTDPIVFPGAFTSTVVARGDGAAVDLSCVGHARAPEGGEPIDLALRFVDSSDHLTPLANRPVSLFPHDGVYPGSCADFYCYGATTDAEGVTSLEVRSGAWYGFEVPGDDEVVRSLQIHSQAPTETGATIDSVVTTRSGLAKLATLARLPREPGASFLAGRVHDCAGGILENVLVSVVSPEGERLQPRAADPEDGAPGTVYFEGAAAPMPGATLASTGENGRFAVGGVVPEPGLPYRIEAWAVTAPGAAPQRIGCESAVAIDDAITVVGIHPERDDYEVDHPCRFP